MVLTLSLQDLSFFVLNQVLSPILVLHKFSLSSCRVMFNNLKQVVVALLYYLVNLILDQIIPLKLFLHFVLVVYENVNKIRSVEEKS